MFLKIFIKRQSTAWQLLLVRRYVIIQPARRVYEYQLAVVLQRHQDALVELCVLAHPGVAVVQVGLRDVLVRHVRQHHEPLLQKLGPGKKRLNY